MSPLQSIPGFASIGEGIYLSRPAHVDRVDKSHPTVVLIFGWMGAKLPHLQKYTKIYQDLYPGSIKILVRSEPGFFWSSKHSREKYLKPALETLEAIGCLPLPTRSTEPQLSALEPLVTFPHHRILVHAFSNGGCWQLTTLSAMIEARCGHNSSRCLRPASPIVLDSSPGSGGIRASQRAFASVIHQPVVRFLVRILVLVSYVLQLLARTLLRRKSALERMKARLNDAHFLPWIQKDTPRLYIYSTGDDMVPARAVEEHIQDALGAGLNVRVEKFGSDSPHVAHARTHPEKYWAAVGKVWKDALSLQQTQLQE